MIERKKQKHIPSKDISNILNVYRCYYVWQLANLRYLQLSMQRTTAKREHGSICKITEQAILWELSLVLNRQEM